MGRLYEMWCGVVSRYWNMLEEQSVLLCWVLFAQERPTRRLAVGGWRAVAAVAEPTVVGI